MIKRKNGFITFVLSFIPGCAEMYWGYMKEGFSLLVSFALVCVLCSILGVGPLIIIEFAAYAYCFFHARNMAHMTDDEIREKKDDYIYDKETVEQLIGKTRAESAKWARPVNIVIAVWLILIGCSVLIRAIVPVLPIGEELYAIIMQINDLIPRIVLAVMIILAGVWLIRGKKEEIFKDSDKLEEK